MITLHCTLAFTPALVSYGDDTFMKAPGIVNRMSGYYGVDLNRKAELRFNDAVHKLSASLYYDETREAILPKAIRVAKLGRTILKTLVLGLGGIRNRCERTRALQLIADVERFVDSANRIQRNASLLPA